MKTSKKKRVRTNKEKKLLARMALVRENRGDWEFQDKTYDRASWKAEVAASDTQLGYFDWVIHKLDAEWES